VSATRPAAADALAVGGVALDRAFAALKRLEPGAHAFQMVDLDALAGRARRLRAAFDPLGAGVAYALKANALPALLEQLEGEGLWADAASLGELELAAAAGFGADRRILNGNGKTLEELDWAAWRGVALLNADHVGELDPLERAAAAANARVPVALRVNPGVGTGGHPHVATGHEEAKFGVAPEEALEAWAARKRWPHLRLDGLHVHVGSQLLDTRPLDEALTIVLALADESARRGAPLGVLDLGGGFGLDYSGEGEEFPVEAWAGSLAERLRGRSLELIVEPGRWLVGPVGVLVAEVLWVKRRGGRRFVVIAAGMNDLLRPALYRARHRIVPVRPRPGPIEPASVVGPVCESADVFDDECPLPPLEPGDLVAILDTGAYGAVMASNYNGRGRLAELVVEGGRLVRARAGESPADLASRRAADPLAP